MVLPLGGEGTGVDQGQSCPAPQSCLPGTSGKVQSRLECPPPGGRRGAVLHRTGPDVPGAVLGALGWKAVRRWEARRVQSPCSTPQLL